MNIEDFVSEAIAQISSGVAIGREVAAGHGVTVGISVYNHNDKLTTKATSSPVPTMLEFDIAVTTNSEKEGKAGIRVMAFSAGGKVGHTQECTSRVKFSLPILWQDPDIVDSVRFRLGS